MCVSLVLHAKYTKRDTDYITLLLRVVKTLLLVLKTVCTMVSSDRKQTLFLSKSGLKFSAKVLIHIEKSIMTIFHSLY